MSKFYEEIAELFRTRGDAAYHGEAVSQTEHALQSAALAEGEGASDALVVAALLHDIGHLIDDPSEELAGQGIDGRHEAVGGAWLASRFGPEVTDPVRDHVDAKRYLCAVDPSYRGGLSSASILSLNLQGGPMNDEEIARFEAFPHFHDAIRLRKWDDTAKIPGLAVPAIDHYRARLIAVESPR